MDKSLSNLSKFFTQRSIIRIVLIIALGILSWWQFTNLYKEILTQQFFLDDFQEYWAASRLYLTGGNPYSPEQLMALERSIGWKHDIPVILWNPPWTLPFILLFGIPAYTIARLLWLIFNVALVIFCSDCLWRFYGGVAKYRWLAWAIGATFVPTLWVLRMGQIGPLILFGIVAFLYFEHRQQFFLAGTVTVLIAIKPHLLYLFWPALFLWAISGRHWILLFGGFIAGLMATVIPLIFNPHLISQYLNLITNQPPFYWATSTLGTLLRLFFGSEKNWLQFMPSVAGLLWFFPYWLKHRSAWAWKDQIPLLLLVSVATTSYGWIYDQVVLLPAIIQAAIWIFHGANRILTTTAIIAYVIINVFALIIEHMTFMDFGQIWNLWMPLTFLLGYLILSKRVGIERKVKRL